ncbi:hypothetical protein [Simkania sp.]|uniref:hypothetical protein n=1 Tax=Simkania sp. TaxID=34094 RepID=UPI003B522DE2
MKKSGLDELEALNLDWKPSESLLTFSIICGDEWQVFSDKEQATLFDSEKKIQDDFDNTNPFSVQYRFGYLR